VRLLSLPVEGKLAQGFDNMDVGQRLRVQLTSVDVDRGFIDFKKVS
jgi:exoribonuclease-2